jgi:NitT/TauT family transport system substrate-binding protein
MLIVGAIVAAGYYLLNQTSFGKSLKEQSEQQVDSGSTNTPSTSSQGGTKVTGSSTDDVLTVQILPWGGFAPGLYFNGGVKHSNKSRFFKEHGLKVDFVIIDDFPSARQAWKVDEIKVMANTADGVLLEYDGIKDYNPEIFLQTDWSRGGDVIIGRRGISSINDLKGKKVAVTPNTPSMTFLAMALNTAGLRLKDIQIIESPDNPTAATIFNSGSVDAAVVWSPSHFESLEVVKGSSILQSTKDAAYALAGIFYAKRDDIEKNTDKYVAFYEGWMKAVAEIKTSEQNQVAAATILGETFDLPVDDAMGMMFDAYLCTHGDNLNYFGLSNDFKGITGSQLHQNTANLLVTQGIIPTDVPNFRSIINSKPAFRAKLSGPGFEAEQTTVFAAPTEVEKTAPAISSKPLTINFASGSAALTPNAKTIIDLQFSDIAKTYANNRIRVEGNTDSVGARDMNMSLSQQRAKAVVDYLIQEYGIDKNRFVVVGNGPDKPVAGCETNATESCKAKNRRTEFQLLAASE